MGLGKRDLLDVQAETPPARDISLDHLAILHPTRDLEAAGMHPVERLAGLFGKAPDGGCGDFDEPRHQLAFAHAAHHASRTRRGLESDLVPIDHADGSCIALCEVKGGCRPQAAGPNDDDIGMLKHRASPWGHVAA
jgi:hypothetical protein